MNQALAQVETTAGNEPLKVKIAGMDCGSCAMTIESSMRQLPGVEEATVSFTTESMEVTGDVAMDAIESRLRELGYRIANENDTAANMVMEHHGLKGFLYFLWEQPPLRSAVLVTAAVIAGIAIIPTLGIGAVAGIPALSILFGAAVIVAGAPVFIKGFRSLIFARRITIDLLMAIAAIGAIGIGETGEAVTVILLFMLGEALEAYSAERARDSLRTLMSLQPQEATVLEAHGDSHGDDHGQNNEPQDKHEHGESCSGHAHDEQAHDDHAGHDHDSHSEHKHEAHNHGAHDDHAGHDHAEDHSGHQHAALKKEQGIEAKHDHASHAGHDHGEEHEHGAHAEDDHGHEHGESCSGRCCICKPFHGWFPPIVVRFMLPLLFNFFLLSFFT